MTSSSQSPAEVQKSALLDEPVETATSPRRRRFAVANSLATAVALSFCAGYLDGFVYIGHGHTFASAMTGNMVLLGLHLATIDTQALANLYPILAYVFGSVVANILVQEGVRRYLPFSPHFATLLAEIAVLVAVAFVRGVDDRVLVAVITISTAMQNSSFRNIGARTYNSVIMTGNLQAFANALSTWPWPSAGAAWSRARDLGAILASFVLGAAAGGVATPRFGNHTTLVPATLLAIVAVGLIFASDDESVFEKARA